MFEYEKVLKKYIKVISHYKKENEGLEQKMMKQERSWREKDRRKLDRSQVYNKIFISLIKLQKKL